MKKTPAARAVQWAKRHGRPMDATVILAWEKGYNAARRDHRREVAAEFKRGAEIAKKWNDWQDGKANI